MTSPPLRAAIQRRNWWGFAAGEQFGFPSEVYNLRHREGSLVFNRRRHRRAVPADASLHMGRHPVDWHLPPRVTVAGIPARVSRLGITHNPLGVPPRRNQQFTLHGGWYVHMVPEAEIEHPHEKLPQ